MGKAYFGKIFEGNQAVPCQTGHFGMWIICAEDN